VIVLDASVAVEILLGSEVGARALDLLESHAEAHVPEHFHIEAISALRRYALRGELGELRAARAMAMLSELRVVRHPAIDLREAIWELREQLSAYDAAYLAPTTPRISRWRAGSISRCSRPTPASPPRRAWRGGSPRPPPHLRSMRPTRDACGSASSPAAWRYSRRTPSTASPATRCNAVRWSGCTS
jgi:predicted nucleic acid-binding protein